MSKEGLFYSFLQVVILSAIIVGVIFFVVFKKPFVGPVLILLSFLPWIPLKLAHRAIKSVGLWGMLSLMVYRDCLRAKWRNGSENIISKKQGHPSVALWVR